MIGQLTVARATEPGYVTAYGVRRPPPRWTGRVDRSDLNYDGRVAGAWSNRLIVEADDGGNVCFYTLRSVEMIVDVNAVTFDTGITSFPNRRTDTRVSGGPITAGGTLRVNVPEAVGAKTVIGQLTSLARPGPGSSPRTGAPRYSPATTVGEVGRSDLNYDGRCQPETSNRLIVQADADGDVCFYTRGPVELVVDVNGVADIGVTSFPNRRTDSRLDGGQPIVAGRPRCGSPSRRRWALKTVVGQLTVAGAPESGFVTAYGCDHGLPVDAAGAVDRSDLNYNARCRQMASNRLIVQADADGDVCFYTTRRSSWSSTSTV